MGPVHRFVWVAQKAYLHGRSFLTMRKEDVILAVFPKTGSTWVRFFLCNLLVDLEKTGDQISMDRMNELMPEFGHPSMFRRWKFRSCPRVVKNHSPANWMTRGHRTILLVRDPRDAAVSLHYMIKAGKNSRFSGDIHDLIRDDQLGFPGFFQQYRSWQKDAVLTLRYEDLRADSFKEFSKLVSVLGIEATEEQIRRAIERSDMNAMRRAQEESPEVQKRFKSGFQFARKGSSGEWKDLFTVEDRKYWQEMCEKYSFSVYE